MIPKVKYYGPRIPSTYAVNMTAAASGSNGITVADDADINPGSGPFFIHLDIVPSGYVGSSGARHNSINNSAGTSVNIPIVFFALSGGNVTPNLFINTVGYPATTSVSSAVFLSANKWTIVVTPQSASSGGSVVYYRNGIQFGSAVTIPAGTPHTFTGSNLIIEGTSTSREPGNTISCIVGNFAPAASEVLDLCTNGVPASWKWGSQTAAYTSDFSAGADGWVGNAGTTVTGNIDGINGSDNWLRAQRTSTTGAIGFSKPYTSGGFKFRVSTKFYNPAGSPFSYAIIGTALGPVSGAVAQSIPANAETVVTYDTPFFPSGSTDIRWILCDAAGSPVSVATGNPVYSKETTFTRLGATMALLPDAIPTSSATTWSDTSGNTGGGTLPAAGATKVTIRK